MFRRRKTHFTRPRHADYVIVACTGILVVFGLVMLASASSHLGQTKFDDTYFYLTRQILYGLSFGVVGFFLGWWINYQRYEKFSLIFLCGSLILLALIFTSMGVHANGASRWLKIGPITFQPSELLKITYIMYLAAWLGKRGERSRNFWNGFFPFLLVSAVISGLLLAEHATSIVVILMGTALIVYFASGAKLRYVAGLALVGTLALAAIVYVTPYRLERVMTFVRGEELDVRGAGYQLNQALTAIGAGGLWGVGYGQSTTKISYLPEPIGDSVFAVVAEEFGFVGSAAVLAVFLILVVRIFLRARGSRDKFGQLLLVGFGSIIALQVFVNVGAISGIIPLTGTPLPFISYGGTALAVFMTISGILVNITKRS